jgi:hypothetical protein
VASIENLKLPLSLFFPKQQGDFKNLVFRDEGACQRKLIGFFYRLAHQLLLTPTGRNQKHQQQPHHQTSHRFRISFLDRSIGATVCLPWQH